MTSPFPGAEATVALLIMAGLADLALAVRVLARAGRTLAASFLAGSLIVHGQFLGAVAARGGARGSHYEPWRRTNHPKSFP